MIIVILVILFLAIIVAASVYYLKSSNESFDEFWAEKRDDVKSSLPAVWSNIEDIVFTCKDKVCEFVTKALRKVGQDSF